MRESEKVEKWVVYETLTGPNAGRKSVCTAGEWKSLECSKPGDLQLVKEGIVNENDAEKLARGTSGDKKPPQQKPRPSFG